MSKPVPSKLYDVIIGTLDPRVGDYRDPNLAFAHSLIETLYRGRQHIFDEPSQAVWNNREYINKKPMNEMGPIHEKGFLERRIHGLLQTFNARMRDLRKPEVTKLRTNSEVSAFSKALREAFPQPILTKRFATAFLDSFEKHCGLNEIANKCAATVLASIDQRRYLDIPSLLSQDIALIDEQEFDSDYFELIDTKKKFADYVFDVMRNWQLDHEHEGSIEFTKQIDFDLFVDEIVEKMPGVFKGRDLEVGTEAELDGDETVEYAASTETPEHNTDFSKEIGGSTNQPGAVIELNDPIRANLWDSW